MTIARVPDFRRQVLAVNRVERLLMKVSNTLDKAGIPYAIVGGNAVAAWVATVDDGAVRATKDVDVLLRRADLPAAAAALAEVGLDQHEVLGVTMFLDRSKPNPKTGAHVLFAGEPVRAHDNYPVPDVSDAVRSSRGFYVLDLPSLLTMKLVANRDIDRVHIRDMYSVDLIGRTTVARMPPDLQARLREIQETE